MGISISGGVKVPQGKFTVNVPPLPTIVNAVNFDGTNDYLTRGAALTGLVDSKTGILSVWLNFATDGEVETILTGSDGTNTDLTIRRLPSDNKLQIIMKNGAGGTIVLVGNDTSMLIVSGWIHILAAWDLATPVFQIYLSDVEDAATPTTLVDDTIDYTGLVDWFIGVSESGGTVGADRFNGDMAEFYFQDGEFLDFTVESNRRLFIDASGKPVDLGSDGSTPTGNIPILFMSGDTVDWHTNDGSGGGFTEVGTIDTASTSPSD